MQDVNSQTPSIMNGDVSTTYVHTTQSNTMSWKRRHALLSGLGKPDEPATPDVADLMEHRDLTFVRNTMELGMLVSEDQDPSLTATLIAPWRVSPPPEAEPTTDEVFASTLPVQEESAKPAQTVAPAAPSQSTVSTRKLRSWLKLPQLGKRVPVLQQMTMVECGAACLAMILSYYGRKTSVSEVRSHCGVGRDGLSALSIVKAARSYGLRVRAISLQENDFRFVTLPAIIHWEFNHFIIVERWSPTYVDLVDPAYGRRRVTAEEFDNGFTGIVLMLEPGVQFNRDTESEKINLRTYALNYVKLAPVALIQILGASLLLQIFGLALPVLTVVFVDQIIPFGLKDALSLLTIGLVLLLLAHLATTLLRASVLLYLQTRVDSQMMLSFFEQLLMLPQNFFLQRSSGDILTRMASNSIIRDTISNQLISTVLDGSFVLVYLLILLIASPIFALLVIVLGLAQLALLVVTNRKVRELATRELIAQGRSQAYAAETLIGITTLKASGAEQRALQKWSNLFFEQMNASVKRGYLVSLIETAMTLLRTFSPILLLVTGTYLVLDGGLSVGAMLGLLALATAFLTPLSSLVSNGQRLQLVHSHLERIADVMEAKPEQDPQAVKQPPSLSGHIRLEDVCFRYDPNSAPVLKNISVTITPGQKVAIVGRTGSGKSTLGSLLLGLYLPSEGEIYYDNIPLRTLNYQEVRAQFGVVMQGSSIFSGSIRQNISLSEPNMSMERVIQAAKAAAIHDDIMEMPMEYETMVSEGGGALSGGQRQRLALARALANSPTVLLLDEATSALDVLTEQLVEQNLRALSCTQIIIAHRLSTIRNADLILVLDQGKICEQGTHQELIDRRGYYAQLIHSQLASGEIKAV
ncbi:MAG TPA: peptidase domain-containing ABC transporter [Ktedonobacteraceae bacterium]|nr:peptidase domain-containing ABC transporter [Ktedonobacteraceae bacterium]